METAAAEPETGSRFQVQLENFTGPFDLLLSLITRRQLDVTEVALASVTDEFIAYINARSAGDGQWDLDEASEFLVIAATLLDIKAARLLPTGEIDAEEDLAALEARDLLFARLLQYKAFKEVASRLGDDLRSEGLRFPRQVSLEAQFLAALPELVWKHTPEEFAALAERALKPREVTPDPEVDVTHLHAAPVSVREQAGMMAGWLFEAGQLSFRQLVSDASELQVVIARFLALLELFRDRRVAFDQVDALGTLLVRWTAEENDAGRAGEDFDGTVSSGEVEATDVDDVEVPEGEEAVS